MADDPIDLVLVTGAGASREFGVNDTKLPLMKEWAAELLKKLRFGAPGFAEAVGLEDGMSGPQFEDRLGGFLSAAEAFPRIKTIVEPLGKMLSAPAPATMGNPGNSWKSWHHQASFQLEQVFGTIYESLYENFGEPKYDPGGVQGAYGALLTQLGIGQGSKWAYATTNYDVIADEAIQALGATFDDGTETPRFRGGAERIFRVEGLLNGIGRNVPLLHLHGRVGWLIRPGTSPGAGPYAVDYVARYDRSFGIPLVMLPDPAKDPQRGRQVIGDMWNEFRQALSRARRVLVLGHSLHDVPLRQALAEHVADGRLAVTLLGDADRSDELSEDAHDVEKILGAELPDAHRVVMRFGPGYGAAPPSSLSAWLNATGS